MTFIIQYNSIISFHYFQTYLLDNPYLRSKFSRFIDRCFHHTEVKYKTIEREITENPDWPPIEPSPGGMANGYTRLVSVSSNHDGSLYCLSDSESDIKSLVSVSSNKIASPNQQLTSVVKFSANQGSLPCIAGGESNDAPSPIKTSQKVRTLSESDANGKLGFVPGNDDSVLSDEITSLAHTRSRDQMSNSSNAIPLLDPPPDRKKVLDPIYS